MDKNTLELKNKLLKLNIEIEELDNEIKKNNLFWNLYSIIVWEYKNISDWDDYFNIWDINDVMLNDIINNNSDDFSLIISNVIWKKDYESKSDYEVNLLNLLFFFIRNFILEKNIVVEWDVKNFLKNYQVSFANYIQNILNHILK